MIFKLKNVRLAFAQNLFNPGVGPLGGEPAYSCTFLVPKEDVAQINEIKNAIKDVASEKWGKDSQIILKKLMQNDKICFKDGETKEEYEGFEDSYYISSRAKQNKKPRIFDTDRTELVESDGKPYSGCYVNAIIDIWAMDNQYGKRINASLLGVQFTKDGDAFGNSTIVTENDFDDLGTNNNEDLF